MQRFKVTLRTDSGIPKLMRKYCRKNGISIWKFLSDVTKERLQQPLNFSIAEIEEMRQRPYEKNVETERFDFGISDTIAMEQLRIIKEEYGIALNTFFVRIISEKLQPKL